jgi:hypothetical protein
MPVPHGKPVNDSLRMDGGGTRDTEDDEDHKLELEVILGESVVDVGEDEKLEELADGVGENDIDKLKDMSTGISLSP